MGKNTVVYKVECFGSVTLEGKTREEVMRKFKTLDPKTLAKEAPVAKVNVIGSPRFHENTLKKFFE